MIMHAFIALFLSFSHSLSLYDFLFACIVSKQVSIKNKIALITAYYSLLSALRILYTNNVRYYKNSMHVYLLLDTLLAKHTIFNWYSISLVFAENGNIHILSPRTNIFTCPCFFVKYSCCVSSPLKCKQNQFFLLLTKTMPIYADLIATLCLSLSLLVSLLKM